MTDEPLKTLKDTGYHVRQDKHGRWILCKDLRAEAIRKANFIHEKFYEAHVSRSDVMPCPGFDEPITTTSALAIRTFILWQNNLTEDDLK